MCSEICPCYKGENNENYNLYSSYGEATVNEFKRTLGPTDVLDDSDLDTRDGVSIKYTAFVWKDQLFSGSGVADGEGGYTSLLECSDDLDRQKQEAEE